jgi:selenocysteine-specific elongation factor
MSTQHLNITLGTAGHVDHGKTALVKMLTGCDTDRLKAEKERQLTIELGFAPCRMADERIVGIVDVPGHVDFIRNMVAGAHGVDVVIFIIAADDGVMPQTREHLDILTLMGCERGLVALTKIDLVDDELRDLVEVEVREFLQGTFLANAPVCPVSSVTGEGFDAFLKALNAVVGACEPHETRGTFRVWIERAFSLKGIGTVVSGIPSSGEVRLGDRLRVVPGGQAGRVRGLQVYGEDAEVGRAGECVAANLSDLPADALDRGRVLTKGDAFDAVTMTEADLLVLPRLPQPLEDYAKVHVHVGTAEAMAHVAILEGKAIAPGESRPVQLRLDTPLALAPGDRFIVRGSVAGLAGGQVTTLGGGRILSTSDVRLRRQRPWTLDRLAARREAVDSPDAWAAVILQEAGEPLSREELAKRTGLQADAVNEALDRLQEAGTVREADGGRLVHRAVIEAAAEGLAEALAAFHADHPLRQGMEEPDLAGATDVPAAVFRAARDDLLAAGRLERRGAVLGLAGQGARLSEADAALKGRIAGAYERAGLEPPGVEDLAADLGEDADSVATLVRLLVDEGTLAAVGEDLVMHASAVEQAKGVVLDLFAQAGGFSTVEFRDALGTSRKFAVPLLDYFDTLRLTVRQGSRRTPGAEAKKQLE